MAAASFSRPDSLSRFDIDGSRNAQSVCNRISSCTVTTDLRRKQPSLVCKASCSGTRAQGLVPRVGVLQKKQQHWQPNYASEQFSQPKLGPLPDRWVEDSIFDIVKNIQEAPFMQLLFDSEDNTTQTQRHKVPKGDLDAAERWKAVKDCVNRASPDGLILVAEEAAVGGCWMGNFSEELCTSKQASEDDRNDNTDMYWGVLVLGRSVARSACYILKTTRVVSTYGTCTRFCLTRAKCFGSSWRDQMQSSWLLTQV